MRERTKIENTIGMFDLLKGIAMLCIVFVHNRSVFPELVIAKIADVSGDIMKYMSFAYGLPIIGRLLFSAISAVLIALMPALLIVAGYGFRKRNIGKSFKAHSKELLLPYLYTTVVTVLFHMCLHYAFFRYLPGAVKESCKVFGGMILGLTQTTSFGELTLFANGPIWFFLAMFWALVIFNTVINVADEKHVPYILMILSLIGWGLSYYKYTPFCLSQGLIGTVYIYIGCFLKKNKSFLRDYTKKEKILIATVIIIPNIILTFFGMVTEMADNVYSLGPVTYIENGLLGIVVLYYFLRLNCLKGKVSGAIRQIGRYSLYIMCIHTVEMIAIPWYFFTDYFVDYPILGFFILYFIRLIIIFIACFMLVKIKTIINTIKEQRRKTQEA